MIVFFRKIPVETKLEDVIEIVEPLLKGGLFKKSGYLAKVEIMILKDIKANKIEYHALATIEPDTVAERVIKKLNRKSFLGKHIAVREYAYRLWHNDRRINFQSGSIPFDERRKSDRRRGSRLEVVDKIAINFDRQSCL